MYRRRPENKELLSEVNVLNLVDVMLVLLIIFILIAPIMEHGIDVRLPTSSPAKISGPRENVTISVAPPGKIYLNDRRVTLDELRDGLRNIARTAPETPVVLRGEDSLDYGKIIKVLDGIRESGLTRIGIATRPRSR